MPVSTMHSVATRIAVISARRFAVEATRPEHTHQCDQRSKSAHHANRGAFYAFTSKKEKNATV